MNTTNTALIHFSFTVHKSFLRNKNFLRFFYSTQKVSSSENENEIFKSFKISTQKNFHPTNVNETRLQFFSLPFATTTFQTFETFQL